MKPTLYVSVLALLQSPPARGRGLKHDLAHHELYESRSPPARGRGLKLVEALTTPMSRKSPPARGRGLKQFRNYYQIDEISRPLRGGVD